MNGKFRARDEDTEKLINNRQAGRRRGRGGQRSPNNPGRPEQGNRIDNRARGNAAQLHEKYRTLARDSQMQGDRVNTEYYLQFADHYFRVLSESRSRFEEQNPQQAQRGGRDDQDDDFDGDDQRGDDRFDGDQAERRPQQQARDQQPREQQRRPRYDEADGNRDQPREPARDVRQQPQPRRDDRFERDEQPAVNGYNGHDATDVEEAAPRRGRPRRERPEEDADRGFDAAILPPSVSVTSDEAEVAPAPRRRGRPPKAKPESDGVQV